MNERFDCLPWHDAELLEVSIDRRNAGERDEIRIRVAWPQGGEAILLFRDCYAMTAEMNFGIIAEERIANARMFEEDPELVLIRERWRALGVSLYFLKCYRIETTSTASVIRIYAKQFDVT